VQQAVGRPESDRRVGVGQGQGQQGRRLHVQPALEARQGPLQPLDRGQAAGLISRQSTAQDLEAGRAVGQRRGGGQAHARVGVLQGGGQGRHGGGRRGAEPSEGLGGAGPVGGVGVFQEADPGAQRQAAGHRLRPERGRDRQQRQDGEGT
jgi:hypothetical protein